MNLRTLLETLTSKHQLSIQNDFFSQDEQIAKQLYQTKEQATIFTNTECPQWKVAGGIYSQRQHIALGIDVPENKLITTLAHAFENPSKNNIEDHPKCQECIIQNPDLNDFPITKYLPQDGGRYITSGVMIICDKKFGLNACYHRLMQINHNQFTMRMVEGRHTHQAYLKNNNKLEAAVCIGNSAAIMLAASMPAPDNIFELEIANTLETTNLAKCITNDLLVPADSEVILEGHILPTQTTEGPFVDLTGTYDLIRQQPIFQVECITHRQNPIWQILLPGKQEHKLLMGMPKEPVLYSQLNKEIECTDIVLTLGGGCWLHAAIQINKHNEDDAKKAIQIAFSVHKSLKHIIVVDTDIDIHNPLELEWAMATRFQASRDIVILQDQPSSSLDPSARHVPNQKSKTDKLGFDATIPWNENKIKFISII
ncbi:MAG: UbiD family decarboxylase [Planctomycetes bacterium]|jgi:UbiD family decarboxylase|nr:UbiD family decarboxylase [Planctomycetota bacterium]